MASKTSLLLILFVLTPSLLWSAPPTESGKYRPINDKATAYVELKSEMKVGLDLDKLYFGFDYVTASARLDWDIIPNRSGYGIGITDGRRGTGIRGEIAVDDFGINNGDGWRGDTFSTKVGSIYGRLYIYRVYVEISRNADFTTNQNLESLPSNARVGAIGLDENNLYRSAYYKLPNDETFIAHDVIKRELQWFGDSTEEENGVPQKKPMTGVRIGYRDSQRFEAVFHVASAGTFDRNKQSSLNTENGVGLRFWLDYWGIRNLRLKFNAMTGVGKKTFMQYNNYYTAVDPRKTGSTDATAIQAFLNRDSDKTDYHNGALSLGFQSVYTVPLTSKYQIQAILGNDSVLDFVEAKEKKVTMALGGGVRFRWPGPWDWDDSAAAVGYAFGRPANGGNRFSGIALGLNYIYRDYSFVQNDGWVYNPADPYNPTLLPGASGTSIAHGRENSINLAISTYEDRVGGIVPNLGWIISYEIRDLYNSDKSIDPSHALSLQMAYSIRVKRLGDPNKRGEIIPYFGLYFSQPTSVRFLKDVQVLSSVGLKVANVIPNAEFDLKWQSGMLTSGTNTGAVYQMQKWGKGGNISFWMKIFY